MAMGEFRLWYSKSLLNLDEGNLREALYCSDMALYALENLDDDPSNAELAKLYLCRGKTLELMGKEQEARSCYKVQKDLSSSIA